MTAPLLDLALSRRIELAEAQAAVDAAETMEKLRPGSGSAVEPIVGGFATALPDCSERVRWRHIAAAPCKPRCSKRAWRERSMPTAT